MPHKIDALATRSMVQSNAANLLPGQHWCDANQIFMVFELIQIDLYSIP
jgi:hypothetical protein